MGTYFPSALAVPWPRSSHTKSKAILLCWTLGCSGNRESLHTHWLTLQITCTSSRPCSFFPVQAPHFAMPPDQCSPSELLRARSCQDTVWNVVVHRPVPAKRRSWHPSIEYTDSAPLQQRGPLLRGQVLNVRLLFITEDASFTSSSAHAPLW